MLIHTKSKRTKNVFCCLAFQEYLWFSFFWATEGELFAFNGLEIWRLQDKTLPLRPDLKFNFKIVRAMNKSFITRRLAASIARQPLREHDCQRLHEARHQRGAR